MSVAPLQYPLFSFPEIAREALGLRTGEVPEVPAFVTIRYDTTGPIYKISDSHLARGEWGSTTAPKILGVVTSKQLCILPLPCGKNGWSVGCELPETSKTGEVNGFAAYLGTAIDSTINLLFIAKDPTEVACEETIVLPETAITSVNLHPAIVGSIIRSAYHQETSIGLLDEEGRVLASRPPCESELERFEKAALMIPSVQIYP